MTFFGSIGFPIGQVLFFPPLILPLFYFGVVNAEKDGKNWYDFRCGLGVIFIQFCSVISHVTFFWLVVS